MVSSCIDYQITLGKGAVPGSGKFVQCRQTSVRRGLEDSSWIEARTVKIAHLIDRQSAKGPALLATEGAQYAFTAIFTQLEYDAIVRGAAGGGGTIEISRAVQGQSTEIGIRTVALS